MSVKTNNSATKQEYLTLINVPVTITKKAAKIVIYALMLDFCFTYLKQ